MLDEKDLQAISQRMDYKLAAYEQGIMGEVQVLMESQFKPQFNLIAEGQKAIPEEFIPRSRVEIWKMRLSFSRALFTG